MRIVEHTALRMRGEVAREYLSIISIKEDGCSYCESSDGALPCNNMAGVNPGALSTQELLEAMR